MAVIKIQEVKEDVGPSIGAGVVVKVWAAPGPPRPIGAGRRYARFMIRSLQRRYVVGRIRRRLSR